jgi:hypothetical protein
MISVARTQRDLTRYRWYGRALLAFAGAGCIAVLVYGALALPHNISAAQGHGVRGTYVPQTLVPVGRGGNVWSGTFTSDSGQVKVNVDYFDQLPPGAGPGSSFPALYQDRQAFPLRGSRVWIGVLIFMVWSAAVLIAIVWLGPVRALRRRVSPQHAATTSGSGL